MRKLVAIAVILVLLLFVFSNIGERLNLQLSPRGEEQKVEEDRVRVKSEESVVIDTVKKVGPSVVTIVEDLPAQPASPFSFGPFSIFGLEEPTATDPEPRNIGSGFIVSADGLIVTNKHVVSDTSAKYQVLTSGGKSYNVERIYRDSLNDIAILKINPSAGSASSLQANSGQVLKPVELGNSSNLAVGQFVIAIGTALGEFRNTVTTGVISGLGRGITAGNLFEGFAEKLDNVIQTDAAINPGNSGGPLLNSSGQVIGINTAVASSAQNIGFAIPVDVIKASLDNFNKGGQFNRPYLGVSYRMLDQRIATLNDLPAGAYIESVIDGSPAQKAGVQSQDIITHYNNKRLQKDKFELSSAIAQNKIGESVLLKIWRNGETIDVRVTLGPAPNQ